MRSLILGAQGTIGTALGQALDQLQSTWHGTYYNSPSAELSPLDVRDGAALSALVTEVEPEVIFFSAGPHDAGWCEQNQEQTRSIIVDGLRNVVQAAKASTATVVFFSSSAVFGSQPKAYHELDIAKPSGTLGSLQAIAEAMLREQLPEQHLIVRTQWVFGTQNDSRCRVGTWQRRLARGQTVVASLKQEGNPTFATDLAEAVLELLKQGETGTVHMVGPDRHTEFTFARQLAHLLGCDVDLVEADQQTIEPNVRLDRQKLRGLLGPHAIRSTADGLRARLRATVVHANAA